MTRKFNLETNFQNENKGFIGKSSGCKDEYRH